MKTQKFNHLENCPQFYTATALKWRNLFKPKEHKIILIESLQFLVKEKRMILYGYVIMDNHIHLIWKPTKLYSLKHTQLSFMKFTAQRIKRNLELNHPEVLKKFRVDLKDRTYQFWQRNPLCIELYNKKINVPICFVIKTSLFESFFKKNNLRNQIDEVLKNIDYSNDDSLDESYAKIRKLFSEAEFLEEE